MKQISENQLNPLNPRSIQKYLTMKEKYSFAIHHYRKIKSKTITPAQNRRAATTTLLHL